MGRFLAAKMLLGLHLALLLLLGCSTTFAANKGSIQVDGYGEVWVIAPDWANIWVGDNAITLNGNSRMYFASYATDGFDSGAYWQTNLMNKVFSYSIDVSNVGCHCNAAAYSSICRVTMLVPGITTVTPTSATIFGVRSMTLMRETSTRWLARYTLAMGEADTGIAVTRAAARPTFTTLTQALCALKTDAQSTPTNGIILPTSKMKIQPQLQWSKTAGNILSTSAMMAAM